MQKIELLVGPIASGKSTYCQKRAKEGAVIINDDSLLMSITGGLYEYDEEKKKLYKSIENSILHLAATGGYDIVIDRTNLSRSTRMRYVTMAKSLGIPIVAVITKDEGCSIHVERRMKHDSRGFSKEKWESVYLEHKALFEPVLENEGFEQRIYL